ncbi:MAG: MFS transporter [Pseudomonadota bacterium]
MTDSTKHPLPEGASSYLGISLVAMAVLSLEIVSMRLWAVESYSSFGYMVLSVAMLGFGVSGTLLAVAGDRLRSRTRGLLDLTSLLFPLTIAVSVVLARQIPFHPQDLMKDWSQVAWVGLLYLIQFLPFFTGSMFIGLLLLAAGPRVGRLYGADLLGSGLGGLMALGAFSLIPPRWLPEYVVVLAFAGHIAWRAPRLLSEVRRTLLAVVVFAAAIGLLAAAGELRMSDDKYVPYRMSTRSVTDARILAEVHGPLGFLQVLDSTSERCAWGLSTATPPEAMVPQQARICVDGHAGPCVARAVEGDDAAFMDWTLSSLPYRLVPGARVLHLGLGGGLGVREALRGGASEVVVAETNGQMVDLLREELGAYTGHLLERPEVSVQVKDGRDLARRSPGRFQIVVWRLPGAGGVSFAGAETIHESFATTLEAFAEYLGALEEDGILVLETTLEPTRRALRLLTTGAEACRVAAGDAGCADRVAFVRSELVGLLIIGRRPLPAAWLDEIRAFAWERQFSASYLPELTEEEIRKDIAVEEAYFQQFDQLNEFSDDEQGGAAARHDPYFDCLEVLLRGDAEARSAYLDEYPFDLEPVRDDRPYFDAFLKRGSAAFLEETSSDPERWVRRMPSDLYAEPLLWVTLVQALALGLLILLIPLCLRRTGVRRRGAGRTVIYFMMLGLGYMLVEMVLIQWLTLFLAEPVYSASIILAILLVSSGVGSLVSGRYVDRPSRGITIAAAGAVGMLLVFVVALTPLLEALLFLPLPARIPVTALFLAPVGFFMGMPFPLGMAALARSGRDTLMAWGWGINGAISVSAIILARVMAIRVGFTWVIVLAAAAYAVAWLAFPGRVDD